MENNLNAILAFLRGKGLNEYAVFGLVANIYVESLLRDDNLQNSYEKSLGMSDAEYVAKVDSGEYNNFSGDKAGFGLCQWTSSGRKAGLYNYMKSKGLSIADINGQLEYLWIELTSSYKKSVLDALYNAKSVDEAARVVMLKFERPADQSEKRQLERVNYGLDFYNKYALKEEGNKMKICLDAGHGLNTSGKRCDSKIDPNATREWTLNSRIANKLGELLKAFDCEVMRVDDVTGASDVTREERVKKANDWKADVYISIHHDAGVYGQAGGGTTVYYSNSGSVRKNQAQALYNHVVGLTGLKGNRYYQIINKGFYVIYNTTMPAFLIENGFMDSTTDVPIILSEDHANKTAQGLLNFLVSEFKLKAKAAQPVPQPESDVIYRVQNGAFSNKANAEALQAKLKADGYEAVIVSGTK